MINEYASQWKTTSLPEPMNEPMANYSFEGNLYGSFACPTGTSFNSATSIAIKNLDTALYAATVNAIPR